MRIREGKPGSPCTKKYLCSNTEFTKTPICTASRKYQMHKIRELNAQHPAPADYDDQLNAITEKICLCEGLCTAAYLSTGILKPKESKAVAICPGPNLAYFEAVYTLQQMVSHIYGRVDLLEKISRPHVFMKELDLYMDYLHTEVNTLLKSFTEKKQIQLSRFKNQLLEGINYYRQLISEFNYTAMFGDERSDDMLGLAESKLSVLFHNENEYS